MRTSKANNNSNLLSGSAIAAATAALGLMAAPALAQQAYEYEPDEGWHEEEWYDPSDWFDDEPYDSYMSETMDYEYSDAAYDAYWDGYFDGFYDDVYGYDYWNPDWTTEYETSYTAGYADGYFDQTKGYAFTPGYYTFTYYAPLDNKRPDDATRTKGDRANSSSKASDAKKQKAADKAQAETRLRGKLSGLTRIDKNTPKGHLVATVNLTNNKPMAVDMGPKMTLDTLPADQGDRVTIKGDMTERNGRSVLVAKKLVVDGKIFTLRGNGADSSTN